MQTAKNERPGVYSSYSASSVVEYTAGRKQVGLVGLCDGVTPNEVQVVSSISEGRQLFGNGMMSDLIAYALGNGAVAVVAVVAEDETVDSYGVAMEQLNRVESLPLIICDSTELEIQQKIRDGVMEGSASRKEKIAIFGCDMSFNVSMVSARAKALNCERVVLVSGNYQSEKDGLYSAAAMAGVVAKESDPALPLNGVPLLNIPALEGQYTDNDLDLLVRSGVTPLEESGGISSIVRGITTKTMSEDSADLTWRELSTLLIVDEVIPDMRAALRRKFLRVKNTEQTRGAIRSQVVLELENKKAKEIIVSYDGISVASHPEDASICLVNFSFAVAHGLNQIWLTAHITV